MADKHGAHQTCEAWVISLVEDFCKSPSAPVGYMISQKLDVSILTATTVRALGTEVLNLGSRIATVLGNEAGVGGGVASGVNVGMCKPKEGYAKTVRAEGQCVLRHDTVMEMNCGGPEGAGNTVGKVQYLTSITARQGFSDGTGGEPPSGPSEGEELRQRTTVKGPDGSDIPVYEDPTMKGTGGYYSVQDGYPSIIIDPKLPDAQIADEIAHELEHANQDYANRGWLSWLTGSQYDNDLGDPILAEIGAREVELEHIKNNPGWTDEQKKERLRDEENIIAALRGDAKNTDFDGLIVLMDTCRNVKSWEDRTGNTSVGHDYCASAARATSK